jgi:predicted N-formylglutamate amidohydrolase
MAGFRAKSLLTSGDPSPVVAENSGARSPFLLVCDHAGRAVPTAIGRLGLPEAAFDTHIAYDIGALELSRALAEALSACLIYQSYSRLVIDCNRSPDHPGSIVTESDGWSVQGNLNLSMSHIDGRRKEIFAPYHARIAQEMRSRREEGLETLLVCIHSFTPSLNGVARPWHVGVLHMNNSPASFAMLEALKRETDFTLGDNQPYAMDGTDYTAQFHALGQGGDALELEVRQDLLQSPEAILTLAAKVILPLRSIATSTRGHLTPR